MRDRLPALPVSDDEFDDADRVLGLALLGA
jgi:hypothetical protein